MLPIHRAYFIYRIYAETLKKKSKKIKNYVIRAKGYLTYRVGGVDSVTSVLNIISAE